MPVRSPSDKIPMPTTTLDLFSFTPFNPNFFKPAIIAENLLLYTFTDFVDFNAKLSVSGIKFLLKYESIPGIQKVFVLFLNKLFLKIIKYWGRDLCKLSLFLGIYQYSCIYGK